MDELGKVLIIGGFALAAVSQIVASILAFRISFAAGFWSLTIPGYLLFAMRRVGRYWTFFAAWGAGVLGVIIGTVMLS